MAGSFIFEPKTIGKLLKSERLRVPVNQRSYKWEEEHVKNLLADFDEAITNDDTDYFLGTIVLVKKTTDGLVVQDGQQRLATTTILLARIRDRLFTASRDRAAQSVDSEFIRSYDRVSEAMVPHITLNDQDNDYYLRNILASQTDPEYEQRPQSNRRSNERLETASNAIEKFLSDKMTTLREEAHADFLNRWVRFIEESASIVLVTATDEVNAYRIFETLNDRGLKASQADILKNYFFSRCPTRMAEAQTMWNTMATNLEREDKDKDESETLVTYLRHLWITDHGPTKERELAANIRKDITAETRTVKFLSDASIHVQDYLAISDPKHVKWGEKYRSSIRKNIEIITDHLQVQQIVPLMFAVAMHFEPEEADKAFGLFVSWSVRFLIYGGRGGMLDLQYALRAQQVGKKEITKARELRDAMSKYVPTDAEFEEAFASARVSRAHLARYYLRALEKYRTADPHPEYVANEDVTDVSLEHVLPFEPSSEWDIDDDTAAAARKLLGNMVLIKASQNRDLGNSGFSSKKNVFAQSGYYTTKDVAEYPSWGISEIKDRQKKLAQTAVKTWSLKFEE